MDLREAVDIVCDTMTAQFDAVGWDAYGGALKVLVCTDMGVALEAEDGTRFAAVLYPLVAAPKGTLPGDSLEGAVNARRPH